MAIAIALGSQLCITIANRNDAMLARRSAVAEPMSHPTAEPPAGATAEAAMRRARVLGYPRRTGPSASHHVLVVPG